LAHIGRTKWRDPETRMRIAPKGHIPRQPDYKLELRSRRPKADLIEHLKRQGIDPAIFARSFYADIITLQNRTRGAVFEVIGEALGRTLLRDTDTATQQHCVETPYGVRRVDLWYARTGVALEIKSGFIVASRSIREQIQKDAWLLTSGAATRIVWLLLRGATQRTRDALDRMRIEWYDIEWDKE
jgi:hypothetical protein